MSVVIPYVRELNFEYGAMERVSPMIRRVIARNPSGFTQHGTGTYVIGQGEVAVIDPGPLDMAHVRAIMDGLRGETITHILITHTHMDHSPATAPLKELSNNPRSYGFGPHGVGKKVLVGQSVEAGGDKDFVPDVTVRHGEVIRGKGWTFECVHTPGHTSNHLCFGLREEKALFTGDHVMGWSTTVISPPDGDMKDYMHSLEILLDRDDEIYWPTHGPAIRDPQNFVRAYIAHRHEREAQIMACLKEGVGRIADMVPVMYRDVDAKLWPAAGRSVLAHLLHMVDTGRAACEGEAGADSIYRAA
ncbi:MAG TPA: MBL fold metallo-hydrolase [Alphaproteobacteria bacterium]|nr:MBL fold metallo-hydrolase [Alphaproteobacteria bacterium]